MLPSKLPFFSPSNDLEPATEEEVIFEKNKRKRRYTLATSAAPSIRGEDLAARRRNLYTRLPSN